MCDQLYAFFREGVAVVKTINQRKAGVVLSYINLIIGCIVPLLYTPIMLRLMGQAEYGLYSLSHSITGYLTLFSLGMGSAIVRYTARYRVDNKVDDIRRLSGMFLAIYGIMALVVCGVGAILVLKADSLFAEGLTSAEVVRLKLLMVLLIISTALSLPISVFSSIISAHERYVFLRGFGIVTTIAIPCLNLVVLFLGGASVGIVYVGLSVQVFSGLLYIWYCTRKLHIRPTFKNMPIGLLKEILIFSLFLVLSSIADMLYWATDKVLIGARLGTTAVAVYNVGGTFTSILQNMAQSISGVFSPKVMMMSVEDNSEKKTSELLKRIGRLQFYIVAFILSGYIVFGQMFLRLWVGAGYEDAYFVALMTMIPLSIPLIQSIAFSSCMAQNKHYFRSIVYAVIAVVNVVATYLILPYYGIIGAAACTAVAFLLGNGIILNVYYAKVINLDIVGFWRTIGRASITPIVLSLVAYSIVNIVLSFETWLSLMVEVIVFTVLFWAATWIFSMNSYEHELFAGMFKKILNIFCQNKKQEQ